jgi:hypothetical protein
MKSSKLGAAAGAAAVLAALTESLANAATDPTATRSDAGGFGVACAAIEGLSRPRCRARAARRPRRRSAPRIESVTAAWSLTLGSVTMSSTAGSRT